MKRKITLNEAESIVKIIKRICKRKGVHLIVVGSVARKEEMVSDIDFITCDQLDDERKYIKFTHELPDGNFVQIDIWQVDKENLRLAKDIRRYPSHYIIALRSKLKQMGYKLTDQELFKGKIKVKYYGSKWLAIKAGITYHPISYYKSK